MRLLLTTACDRVLDDTEHGISLITIIHEITVQVPREEVPANAVIPREWMVYTKLGLEPEEEGRTYVLDLKIFLPDGTLFGSAETMAKQPTNNGMGFKTKFLGFPIGQPGTLKIVQTIRSEGVVVCGPFESEVLVRFQKTVVAA